MEAQRQEWEQRHAQAMEEMRTKQEEDERKEKPAPESSRRGRRRCQSSSSSSTESEEQEEDSSDDEEEDETSGSDDEGSPIPPPAVPKPRPRLVEKNAQSKAVGRVLPRRPPIKLSPAKPIHRRLVLRAKRRTAASAWRQRTQPSHARSRAPAPDNSKREERLLRRKRLLRAEQGASPEKRARREERSPAHGKRTSLVAPESAGGSDSSETPAPRTRAKIKVDIDLWKLDDSGALPGIGSSGSSKGGGGPGSSKGGGPESSKGGGPQGLAVVREPGKERKSASGNGKDNAKPRARRFRRNTISGGLPKVNGEV
ncbi:unnamed protein product [Cyprideis torosa]|uniref:Uncharacterized protein n=1 Tax=Cyprideis torosa TaxID=163714 RepID=A0A7R8WPB1_9CRUS|nr:unnamed protein product [Cyprideis torosa]CAG0901087.1 unnamed protein product [Cyprideis torosa]